MKNISGQLQPHLDAQLAHTRTIKHQISFAPGMYNQVSKITRTFVTAAVLMVDDRVQTLMHPRSSSSSSSSNDPTFIQHALIDLIYNELLQS